MKVTLKIFEADQEVISKELQEGSYTIGRDPSCDISLDGDGISRQHLEVRVTESAVYLTNMSSSGKVFFHGKPIETVELSSGDQFNLGPYKVIAFFGTQPKTDFSHALLDSREEEPKREPEPAPAPPERENAFGFGDFGGGEPFGGGGGAEPAEPEPRADGGVIVEEPAAAAAPELVDDAGGSVGGETLVQPKPLVAKILFEEGPRKGEELFIETYEITLGRSKRADIYIDDDKLSRVHAKITRVGMGYRLIDLNSRNGTYVNGMRILEHPLSSFDTISLGRSKIKFLIHDIMIQEQGRQAATQILPTDQTRSVMLTPTREAQILALQQAPAEAPPAIPPIAEPGAPYGIFPTPEQKKGLTPLSKLLLGSLVALGVVYLVLPGGDKTQPAPKPDAPVAQLTRPDEASKPAPLPPSMPQEFLDLSPEAQRALEGHYRSALRAAEREMYDEAVFHLGKIHEQVPYYKESRDLLELYNKKVKESQIAQAEEKAKRDEKQDLVIFLEEGLEYLKVGDFDRAAESFNSAIVVDPTNEMAKKGLRAAELKIRDIEKVPAEQDPEADKRQRVIELFQKAVAAFANKSYSEAIQTAEEIRKIELSGDTQYLSEAKQIIDRARMLQKEEFEPFLIQAKEKYAEADYNASRDLCEEMTKRDPSYAEAQECLLKARKQLNRLAKEAYVHGYILESMNKIEEAKQYWIRAKNYVRKGDDYYDKINKKLDYYQ